MAAPHQIKAAQRSYTVVDDRLDTYRALIIGSVEDMVAGGPLQSPFVVEVGNAAAYGRAVDGGLFCVAGYPEQVFPGIGAADATLSLGISATGYRPVSLTVKVPRGAAFPIQAPPIAVQRLPIRIQGRVTADTSSRPPIPNARISAIGGPILLRTPLAFDHAAGITVRQRQLIPAGADPRLVVAARAGERVLTVSQRTGLKVGSIVRIGPASGYEYGRIERLAPRPADLARPGEITLQASLRRSLPEGARIQPVFAGSSGAARRLARPASAGDGLLLLDGDLNAQSLEIVDPVAGRVEYHTVGALSGADGFYRLDGVGQVSVLTLKASASRSRTVTWEINYGQPVNIVNFRL